MYSICPQQSSKEKLKPEKQRLKPENIRLTLKDDCCQILTFNCYAG